MSSLLRIVPGILLLAAAMSAQDAKPASWQDDLNYLIRRIEIMHPNPYAFFPKEEFYRLKDKLISEIPGLSDVEIVVSFSELLASLKDGHTGVGFEYSDPEWLNNNLHLLPFILYPFDDGVFIMAGLPQHRDLVGARVVKIGKMPAEEAALKLGRLFSHDNASGEKKSLYYSLAFAEMLKRIGAVEAIDRMALTLRHAKGREFKKEIATVSFIAMAPFLGTWYPQASGGLATMNQTAGNPLPLWLKDRESRFWFEYLPGEKTMFLQINSLQSPRGNGEGSFGQFCDRFFQAFDQQAPERLVIDIRANNGGNHVELPLLKGILARPRIDRHDRLFLVTGRVTFSAAQHLATVFDKYTNATIIGEPTAGKPNHYGSIRRFQLPNHPQVVITSSIDYYQDSEPFDFNTTTAPDIATQVTSSDYRDNIDPAMRIVNDYERICAGAQTLGMEMGREYAAGGPAGMKKAYFLKKGELLDSGYNLEKFFFEFIDSWLAANKKSTADYLDFLAFACGECPASLDLCYELAAQLEAEGRLDEAEKYYGQCLQLNPDCHYAKMKLGLMELKRTGR